MLSHILHENTIMNMIEGMRKAYKIIIERNTSHALFEDDIVLATSSRAFNSIWPSAPKRTA